MFYPLQGVVFAMIPLVTVSWRQCLGSPLPHSGVTVVAATSVMASLLVTWTAVSSMSPPWQWGILSVAMESGREMKSVTVEVQRSESVSIDNIIWRGILVSIKFGKVALSWYWWNLNLAIWMFSVIGTHTLSLNWRVLIRQSLPNSLNHQIKNLTKVSRYTVFYFVDQ